jgi:NAD(P)-dependent dehydrogenase (short-subunit alcohol dehydrogenase family)
MKGIVVVTGASSGFGRLTAEALALNGHTVYAAMREKLPESHFILGPCARDSVRSPNPPPPSRRFLFG